MSSRAGCGDQTDPQPQAQASQLQGSSQARLIPEGAVGVAVSLSLKNGVSCPHLRSLGSL